VDLPVITILSGNVLQEHQLCLQAVLIAKSSGAMHHIREYSFLNSWVMVGVCIELEIDVFGLSVHFLTQRAIRLPVNINVQEREVAAAFSFHGELYALVDAV
jgi:hypothetical protein